MLLAFDFLYPSAKLPTLPCEKMLKSKYILLFYLFMDTIVRQNQKGRK